MVGSPGQMCVKLTNSWLTQLQSNSEDLVSESKKVLKPSKKMSTLLCFFSLLAVY